MNPYNKFPERKTNVVARDMIGTLKAPLSRDMEQTYLNGFTVHVYTGSTTGNDDIDLAV